MRSLLKSISRFFQRLLHGGSRSSSRSASRELNRRPDSRPDSRPTVSTVAGSASIAAIDLAVPSALRQLLYQAIYELPQQKRTHAAQVGALLRQKDRSFSYEKYNFAKLLDLLEAVPDLVALERVDPDLGSPSSAPVYYVRPTTDIKRLLTDTLTGYDSADGWVHVDSLRRAIATQLPTFSAQKYGFIDFSSFIESRSDLIEVKADSPSYVRLCPSTAPLRVVSKPRRVSPSIRQRSGTRPVPKPPSHTILHLSRFAGFSPETLHQKVSDLAAIALRERWYFGPEPPADFPHPILKSYLRYTFIRLQHEQKVLSSTSYKYRAFNTGLLDRLLRPIYALLTQQSNQTWDLDFCIPGEGSAGKKLVAKFTRLPVAANYLANPEQAFYHLAAGGPEVDWRHVVQDNMERLPSAFIEQYAPAGFTPRDTQTLIGPAFHSYKREFAEALDADSIAYRNIVNRLEEALSRTLLKTQINYKTAVPTYYPKINSIDLLLPICLVDEDIADCAIVARREPSGKYIGHTILTMRQAYNNARLICQLDEHWLSRSMTLSQEDFDDDDDSEEFVTQDDRSTEDDSSDEGIEVTSGA